MQSRTYLYYVTSIAALGGLLFGFETGIIAGALIFINQEFNPTIGQQELIVSIAVLGALFGALISGRLADLYGRHKLLIIAAWGFILGTLIASLASSIDMLILGRFILGLSIGMASFIAPLFIAEIAPAEKRGRLVLLNGITITSGQVLAFLIGYYFAEFESWRWMIGVGLLPSLLLLLGMYHAPPSPRWLVLKNRSAEALTVLRKLHKANVVEHELAQIKHSIDIEQNARLKDLLTKHLTPVLTIGIALGLLQQFVGINTVMYYGPTIFEQVGFVDTKAKILATLGMGVVNLLATIFILLTVDRWGRRQPLIVGTIIAGVSLFVLGYLLSHDSSHPLFIWLAVFCLVTYMAGYAISVGSLFWLIISEIFPLRVRGVAMSLVTAIQWGGNFIVASTFLSLLNLFGASKLFWLYGFMALLAAYFSYRYIPETKGVALEDIEEHLLQGVKVRDLGLIKASPRKKRGW